MCDYFLTQTVQLCENAQHVRKTPWASQTMQGKYNVRTLQQAEVWAQYDLD